MKGKNKTTENRKVLPGIDTKDSERTVLGYLIETADLFAVSFPSVFHGIPVAQKNQNQQIKETEILPPDGQNDQL